MEVTCLVLYNVCATFNIIFMLFEITRFVRNRSNRKKSMLNRKMEKNNTIWFCDFSKVVTWWLCALALSWVTETEIYQSTQTVDLTLSSLNLPLSSHSLQAANCCRNSRLVVDEDDL